MKSKALYRPLSSNEKPLTPNVKHPVGGLFTVNLKSYTAHEVHRGKTANRCHRADRRRPARPCRRALADPARRPPGQGAQRTAAAGRRPLLHSPGRGDPARAGPDRG
ncbi:protein of unknown function [Pseudomonas sp. JV551A1]|uniref:Uncharacterized protein n=1 Tax=Pseudomonas inefficax TaxID=2078786 RepID=A0AAQ1PA72_9PSED|nr:protein of unknown function [Pseudomonas sp. JV551A1]SPO61367.1 protein of unknown function [Pseudomonas inefficax]